MNHVLICGYSGCEIECSFDPTMEKLFVEGLVGGWGYIRAREDYFFWDYVSKETAKKILGSKYNSFIRCANNRNLKIYGAKYPFFKLAIYPVYNAIWVVGYEVRLSCGNVYCICEIKEKGEKQ